MRDDRRTDRQTTHRAIDAYSIAVARQKCKLTYSNF